MPFSLLYTPTPIISKSSPPSPHTNPLRLTPLVPCSSTALQPISHVSAASPRPHAPLCAAVQQVIFEEEDDADSPDEYELIMRAGLRKELMPNHVAVIMDGNRRWARLRGLPVGSGHEAGRRSLRTVVKLCGKLGIRALTVFAFSDDNWLRPRVEVDFLMSLFEKGIKDELDSFIREDVRISIIGDLSKLPSSLQKLLIRAMENTKNNARLQLIIAVSYSGQYDIVQAFQKIASKVRDGDIEPHEINKSLVEQELETNCSQFPYPDILIRTSGELRVSNFYLWQLAYTELFFSQSLWPDFGEAEFLEALRSFQQRQRRYGGK